MRKILEELGSRDTIAIGGHVRPDGDCVGSCMGMYLYLKKALPDAQIDVYLEKPAGRFNAVSIRLPSFASNKNTLSVFSEKKTACAIS